MLLRQRFFITLAAAIAVLIPAHASAGVIASCEATPPTQALNGGANPLAETFAVTTESDVDAISVVAGDTGGGSAHIALVRTTAAGAPDETAALASAAVHLAADPAAVQWTLTDPVRLVPATYAVVVQPAGVLAWERCAASDGGWFRNGDGVWNAFPQRRLTFAVDGQPADHTPPVLTFGPLASPTRATSVDVSFSADEPATFTCAVDDDDAAPCGSPLRLDDPAEGGHVVHVVATDRWGNAAAPATVGFRVDRTPPVVTLSAAAPHAGSHAIGLTFSADEAAGFGCSVAGAGAVACTSPSSVDAPAEGPLSVNVTATDAAGNVGTATASVLADWTPPDLTLPADISTTADEAAGAVVTYSVGASDGWDEAVTAACEPASGTRFPVGDSLVVCSATDASGNTGSGSFKVHVAAPPITAAELDIGYDAAMRALAFTELHGGTLAGQGTDTLTASAGGHATLARLHARGHDGRSDGVSITSLTYDGAAPVRPGRNLYAVRIAHGRDGSVRRIVLAAFADGDGIVVRYRAQSGRSTVWRLSHGQRVFTGSVPGLVVPHLRTSAGAVVVTLAG